MIFQVLALFFLLNVTIPTKISENEYEICVSQEDLKEMLKDEVSAECTRHFLQHYVVSMKYNNETNKISLIFTL